MMDVLTHVWDLYLHVSQDTEHLLALTRMLLVLQMGMIFALAIGWSRADEKAELYEGVCDDTMLWQDEVKSRMNTIERMRNEQTEVQL